MKTSAAPVPEQVAKLRRFAREEAPEEVKNQAKARTFCGNDTTKQYIPGVGGCLD